jgi:hypothetical protein
MCARSGCTSVSAYRFYVLDESEHVSQPPQIVECAGDEDAIRQARQLLDGKVIEVWDEARRIVRLEPQR